jgi:hypothetical protein
MGLFVLLVILRLRYFGAAFGQEDLFGSLIQKVHSETVSSFLLQLLSNIWS